MKKDEVISLLDGIQGNPEVFTDGADEWGKRQCAPVKYVDAIPTDSGTVTVLGPGVEPQNELKWAIDRVFEDVRQRFESLAEGDHRALKQALLLKYVLSASYPEELDIPEDEEAEIRSRLRWGKKP